MKISIQSIAAILVADIDIFLLQNENQMADNDKEFYTKEILHFFLEFVILLWLKKLIRQKFSW